MAKPSFLKLSRVDIENMSDYVLKATIKSVAKTVKSRMRRIEDIGLGKYSYTFKAAENVSQRMGGKLTTATYGKTRKQLERQLQDWLSLYRVGETAGQVKSEFLRNIKNFFKEPRYTREFLEMLGDNIDALYDLWLSNESVIKEVLGSDRFKEGIQAYQAGDIDHLKELIQEVSDALDVFEDEEKSSILEQFVAPEWGDFQKW
ncbi:MAG: hypothetical protein J6S85_26645 [Methanobrevibacter sp.]|nr:hypothetical protein [Methanobrevibacter sp.]MBO7717174.1 hypothetical protein [Methanobrevibacter sp.]